MAYGPMFERKRKEVSESQGQLQKSSEKGGLAPAWGQAQRGLERVLQAPLKSKTEKKMDFERSIIKLEDCTARSAKSSPPPKIAIMRSMS